MKKFYKGNSRLIYLLLQVLQTTYINAVIDNDTMRKNLVYVNNYVANALGIIHIVRISKIRMRTRYNLILNCEPYSSLFFFLHSFFLQPPNEVQFNPTVHFTPITVTGTAVIDKPTRYFWDILASARNSKENRYNNGIRYLGVKNFLSAAAKFCREETREGKIDIVSIGCSDGYVEKNIVTAYHERFGNLSHLNVILVDPDERFRSKVDFRYVDDLIEQRPHIVNNCVLFIFCPFEEKLNNGYDVDSIRKLKPKSILVEYSVTGESGSRDLIQFLDPDGLHREESGLDYYPIREVLLQTNWMNLGTTLVKVKKMN